VPCGDADDFFIFLITPFLTSFFKPAMDEALAGSTKMPSTCAKFFVRQDFLVSDGFSGSMPDSRMALTAFFQLTGAPMRMAVAMVSGFSTGTILSLLF
jgi:hypothetical protein